MIKSSIKIAISADSRKTTLKKEIFFIGSNDNKRFPDVYHQNEEIQPLVVFGNAIAQAKESLLIIDAYIFKFDDAGERKKYIEYILIGLITIGT